MPEPLDIASTVNMSRQPSKRRGTPEALGVVLLTFVALYFALAFIGWDHGNRVMGLQVLPQLLGTSLVLIGAVGIVKAGPTTTTTNLAPAISHIAIVLVGGIFLAGGWASMLGLALLGSVAIVVQHLAKLRDAE